MANTVNVKRRFESDGVAFIEVEGLIISIEKACEEEGFNYSLFLKEEFVLDKFKQMELDDLIIDGGCYEVDSLEEMVLMMSEDTAYLLSQKKGYLQS